MGDRHPSGWSIADALLPWADIQLIGNLLIIACGFAIRRDAEPVKPAICATMVRRSARSRDCAESVCRRAELTGGRTWT